MRITIIGCGHVGLVTSCCLAYLGHTITCTDQASDTMENLKRGVLTLYEPHLKELMDYGVREGRLMFTDDPALGIRSAEVILLCMDIGISEDGDSDYASLESAARLIAAEAHSYKVVVARSTMPVQAGGRLKEMLCVYGRKKQLSFSVAANPHFLREGTAVDDFLHSNRILIGVDDSRSEDRLRELYRPILERTFDCPLHPAGCSTTEATVLVTSVQSAELIKHASNAFLAMKISYINLIAELCDRLGGDISEVSCAMGHDPRIGPSFLEPGLGFGGFRLTKDLRALIALSQRVRVPGCLLKEVERVNSRQIDIFVEKTRRALWILKDKQIGVLGLSFKAETDDIRSSPAIALIKRLHTEGARIRAYDPEAHASTSQAHPEIALSDSPYEVAAGAEALIVATPWDEFRQLDWIRMRNSMMRPLLIDGRNLLNPVEMRKFGFEYYGCGRGSAGNERRP